jgi:hypothetical protein
VQARGDVVEGQVRETLGEQQGHKGVEELLPANRTTPNHTHIGYSIRY